VTALNARQFDLLRGLIYQSLGLHFEESKTDFLEKRVEKRMATLRIAGVDDYLFHLRFLDAKGEEMQALANLITTNETYMFREFEQLQGFADHCLPEAIAARERRRERALRVWSAGCSSGEEAYTLAIILREVMHDADRWDLEVVATDVDEVRLGMARAATYGARSVKDVPEAYAARHLEDLGAEQYRVRAETRRLVDVRHLNLQERARMRSMRGFDFVFCRNVLIYFDDASRRAVVDHLYQSLNPGGFVFLGHSESVGRISTAFKLKRLGPHLVYFKE
jgi:chemotaxis protein methyltransferase CheR